VAGASAVRNHPLPTASSQPSCNHMNMMEQGMGGYVQTVVDRPSENSGGLALVPFLASLATC
jgi:hypothetical protein